MDEPGDKPDPVPHRSGAVAAIPLGTPLPAPSSRRPVGDAVADALVATSPKRGRRLRPTRELGRAALERSLSGLAPGGVYRAARVTSHAGGLLHHRFTLTGTSPEG